MTCLVSVITPTYNSADFIDATIKSVLDQTYRNWEMIIVDDCSDDNTISIVSQYRAKDSRIQLICLDENSGAAVARNAAIEVAKGRFIAFVDSDDYWVPEKLEKQLVFMKKRNVSFSFSGYTTITEQDEIIDYIKPPAKVTFRKMLKHNYISCLTAIYDTKPYGKVYMPLIKKRQDYALWLMLLQKFDSAYSLQESLAFYRIRKQSLSKNKFDALRYFWLVLRTVANLPLISSIYYVALYALIVGLKKLFPKIYNFLIRKSSQN